MAAAAMAALGRAGCANMQGIDTQAQLRDAPSLGLAAPSESLSPAPDWWAALGDAQLNRLVAEALAGNPNLRVAAARVGKARAAQAIAEAAYAPQVTGAIDLNRQSFSSNYIYPAPLGGSTQTLGNLQINGGWELDFFRQARRRAERRHRAAARGQGRGRRRPHPAGRQRGARLHQMGAGERPIRGV